MHPFIGYFILSIVVLGVLSFIHMVSGIGGIGGASSRVNKHRTLLAVIAVVFAIVISFIGGSTALGACITAASIVFLFWSFQR